MQLYLRILSGMANSADSDQTVPLHMEMSCLNTKYGIFIVSLGNA